MYTYMSESEEDTKELAKRIGMLLKKGDVLILEGDLGVGKTTFTKGIALGLQITRNVTSPTFTMMKQYKGGTLPLYHIDAYRLESGSEDIGFEELIGIDGIAVIEWGEFIMEFLPEDKLIIEIEMIDLNKRKITLKPTSLYYEKIVKKIC